MHARGDVREGVALTSDELAALRKRLERERAARAQAEEIAESATRKLYGDVQRTLRDLETAKRRLDSILATVAEGICGVDAEGRITFLNPAGAKLLRVEAKDVLGRPEHEVLHQRLETGAPYPEDECPIARTLQFGTPRSVENDILSRSDGSWFLADYTCAPLDEGGVVGGAVLAFRDVTELREREEMLRRYVADLEAKRGPV